MVTSLRGILGGIPGGIPGGILGNVLNTGSAHRPGRATNDAGRAEYAATAITKVVSAGGGAPVRRHVKGGTATSREGAAPRAPG
jgi:hypothetical protein